MPAPSLTRRTNGTRRGNFSSKRVPALNENASFLCAIEFETNLITRSALVSTGPGGRAAHLDQDSIRRTTRSRVGSTPGRRGVVLESGPRFPGKQPVVGSPRRRLANRPLPTLSRLRARTPIRRA